MVVRVFNTLRSAFRAIHTTMMNASFSLKRGVSLSCYRFLLRLVVDPIPPECDFIKIFDNYKSSYFQNYQRFSGPTLLD